MITIDNFKTIHFFTFSNNQRTKRYERSEMNVVRQGNDERSEMNVVRQRNDERKRDNVTIKINLRNEKWIL